MKSYTKSTTAHNARIIIQVTQQGDDMPKTEITGIHIQKPEPSDPARTVTFTIPELHKLLREYEVSNPLPEFTPEEIAAGLRRQFESKIKDGMRSIEAAIKATGRQPEEVKAAVRSVTTRLAEGETKAAVASAEPAAGKAPLLPVHAGLLFPKDKVKLQYISSKLRGIIGRLGGFGEGSNEKNQRFEDLRHFARNHGHDDFQLMECISSWSGIIHEWPILIEQVKNSILTNHKESIIAEKLARLISPVRATPADIPTPTVIPPGYAFNPRTALLAISNLLQCERPQVIERIKSVIERTDMNHSTSTSSTDH